MIDQRTPTRMVPVFGTDMVVHTAVMIYQHTSILTAPAPGIDGTGRTVVTTYQLAFTMKTRALFGESAEGHFVITVDHVIFTIMVNVCGGAALNPTTTIRLIRHFDTLVFCDT